jgi:O-antigen/teichoic acid export membrane protein
VSVRRNAVANSIGQCWTIAMGLVFVPLYIDYLGIEAYGLIGMFALLQIWLSLLDMGMTATLSREFARFQADPAGSQPVRDLLRSVEVLGAAAGVVVVLAIYAAAEWIASQWLRVERLPLQVVAQALCLIGVVAGLRILENIYRSSLQGMQRQVELNLVVSIAATLRGAGAVAVLAWVSPTIGAFFIWQALVSVLTIAAAAWLVYSGLPATARGGRFSWLEVQAVWRFAAGTSVLTLLGMAMSQTDKLILSKLLSLEEFAYYSLAFTIASSIRLLTQPVDTSIYPRLIQLLAGKNERDLTRLYHKAAQASAILMGSATALLVVMGEDLLRIWTGNADLAARVYPLTWVLAIGMLLNGLMNGPYYLQMAAGWTGLMVRANAVMFVLLLPLVYVLTLRFGALGGALSWLAVNAAYFLVVVPLMHRRLLRPEMWRWFVLDIGLPVAAAAATLLLLKLMQPTMASTPLMVVFIGAAFLATLLFSAIAAKDVRDELLLRLANWSRRAPRAG